LSTEAIIALVVVLAVALVLIVAVVSFMGRRKQGELRNRFGPEYERTVKEKGRRKAEQDLAEREKRVSKLELRELSADERQDFGRQWHDVQAKFVDAPRSALQEADVLVQHVMNKRGYPVSDFDQRAADISVDHGEVATNYREAHSIAQKADTATTEQMRQAMLHYRGLFDELLGTPAASAPST
jgi:hypothetical protein